MEKQTLRGAEEDGSLFSFILRLSSANAQDARWIDAEKGGLSTWIQEQHVSESPQARHSVEPDRQW